MCNLESRFSVFGTCLSRVTLKTGFEKIINKNFTEAGYVSFPSSDVVAKAYKNKELRSILNHSFITFTDGKFTEFYIRLKGEKAIKNASGFDLLNLLLETDKSHFFYGLNEKQLHRLKKEIEKNHPEADVLGYKSPPYLKLHEIQNNEIIKRDINEINKLGPDFIWVGISSPKQDYLMSSFAKDLNKGLMFGVGTVLLYKAGIINKGPDWVKKIGMRWLVRMIQEPVRIYKKRTVHSIIYFMYLCLKHDIFRIKTDAG